MIHFLVPDVGSFSIQYYLAEEGRALADRMRVVLHEELHRQTSWPLGSYILAGVDQLSARQARFIAAVWERLAAAGVGIRLLNHPDRIKQRYELLCAAHEAGLNRFRAWRAADLTVGRDLAAAGIGYPVFVRFENEHTGSLTPLVHSAQALRDALVALLASGLSLRDLLVVEFCDTRDDDGIYRKYSAFMVGDRVLPRYLECSREWTVKWHARIFDARRAELERAYIETNPHEEWVRQIFQLARVEYGRIDYGVHGGEPQVWEINTNPTIGRGPGPPAHPPHVQAYKRLMAPAFERFYSDFLAAWQALDTKDDPGDRIPIDVPAALIRSVEADLRRRRREERVRALVDRLARQRWIKPLTRSVKSVLAGIARVRT